jgi:hypothetical protein
LKLQPQYSAVALVLALALLCGSMPVVASVVPHSGDAAFALDICHPAQTLDRAAVPCNLPIPATYVIAHVPSVHRAGAQALVTLADHIAEAPDPPPPKTLA